MKKEFETVQQKMPGTGFSAYQSYMMNKKIHTIFEDTCDKFKVEQEQVLKNAQVVFNPEVITALTQNSDIMATSSQQHDMIAVNDEQMDKICKMNETISAYFEYIQKHA